MGDRPEDKQAVWTPNLIVPGVAKCGTTTLFDLLTSHPQVTGGHVKELRFLIDPAAGGAIGPTICDHGLAAWREQFPDRGMGHFRYWVDASPQYQFHDIARQTIASLDAQPRVLFITRQPSRRLFSLYQYERYQQRALPHVHSFAQFIDEIRAPEGKPIAERKILAHAWEDSHYDRMLEHWHAIMAPGLLYVMAIEDLRDERHKTICALAEWLDIDAEPFLEARVDRSNATVATRSKLVRRMGSYAAKRLPETPLIRRAKNFIRELNSAVVDRGELEENRTLIDQLDLEFAPAMARLARLRAELLG